MNPLSLIEKYCAGNPELERILFLHSKKVADMALRIANNHPELNLDQRFIFEAAMLHDLGVVKVSAPGIHCFGSEPYIKHGLCGAEILRSEGLPLHARVAERHTGTGLTKQAILSQGLPLPPQDFCPETLAEKLICYADKFYSKTHPEVEKTYERACHSLQKFGEEGISIFDEWHKLFGV